MKNTSCKYSGKRAVRVAIVLPKLGLNGIQKVHIQLANHFFLAGLEVDIVTGDPCGALRHSLHADVGFFDVGRASSYRFYIGLCRYLKQRKPSHVISAYEDVSAVLLFLKGRFFGSFNLLLGFHNSIAGLAADGGQIRKVKYRICLYFLEKNLSSADSIVAVSKGLAAQVASTLGIARTGVHVIYNPVISEKIEDMLSEPVADDVRELFSTVTVGFFGRLRPQKRVDLLLRAFAQVLEVTPAQLVIVGEGDELDSLKHLAESLDITSNVRFVEFQLNPLPLMKMCELVVLSSQFEGLGNVLIEAMSTGTQVISTDCPHGPSEILEGGRFGQLVPVGQVRPLADAIVSSLEKNFWVDKGVLEERADGYSTENAAQKYLALMGLR
ncbi:MAG: glycosyltransferase [Halioglobus sp.]